MSVRAIPAPSAISKQIRALIDWLIVIYELIGNSIGDGITTLLAFGTVAAIALQQWPSLAPWAMFTCGSIYAVLFLLRLVRKFQNHPSHDDLYEFMAEKFEGINERIDEICRNII